MIQNSLRKLIEVLNVTLSEINAADQVDSGASQIAFAAQGLNGGRIAEDSQAALENVVQTTPPPKIGEDSINSYLTGIARISEDGLKEAIVLCLKAA